MHRIPFLKLVYTEFLVQVARFLLKIQNVESKPELRNINRAVNWKNLQYALQENSRKYAIKYDDITVLTIMSNYEPILYREAIEIHKYRNNASKKYEGLQLKWV